MITMPRPVLQVRRSERSDWWVAATWPDGRSEAIRAFASESDANEWIAKRFQAWLDEHDGTK